MGIRLKDVIASVSVSLVAVAAINIIYETNLDHYYKTCAFGLVCYFLGVANNHFCSVK